MDELSCPRCKTTKYRNPQLKLLVNVCGHGLCENCIELLFVKGSSNCPECGATLRRSNFRLQLFEDPGVEKEVDIRRRILRDYNKQESDFESLREYNDYLEEIETIICNLSNDIDIEATKKKVETYKKENKDCIIRNKLKFSRSGEELEEILEMEKEDCEIIRQQHLLESEHENKIRVKNKEALIDELMFSDMPANDIVNIHKCKKEETIQAVKIPIRKPRTTKFSSGINLQKSSPFLPVPKSNEGECYKYVGKKMNFRGPPPPELTDLDSRGYMRNIRSTTDSELAGGFTSNIACQRALQEAFSGLFVAT